MSSSGKEMIYSLHNADNFKKELGVSYNDVVYKLSTLLTEYLKFYLENTKIKNIFYVKFVIMRGLHTIVHVFRYLLQHSKNIDLTYFHCQKSFYFYVEFVGQILEDDKSFLQLTTRDAVIYVYKKTIYDINNEIRKNNQIISNSFSEMLQKIDIFTQIAFVFFHKVIEDINPLIDSVQLEKNISTIATILHTPFFINLNLENMVILEKIIDQLNFTFKSSGDFFDIILVLFKKIIKSSQNVFKLHQKLKMLDNSENETTNEQIKDTIFSFLL